MMRILEYYLRLPNHQFCNTGANSSKSSSFSSDPAELSSFSFSEDSDEPFQTPGAKTCGFNRFLKSLGKTAETFKFY